MFAKISVNAQIYPYVKQANFTNFAKTKVKITYLIIVKHAKFGGLIQFE